MGLVQRAVSVMMYGNGTAKQVGDNDGQIVSLLLVFIFYCTCRYLLICSPFVFACHIKGEQYLLIMHCGYCQHSRKCHKKSEAIAQVFYTMPAK